MSRYEYENRRQPRITPEMKRAIARADAQIENILRTARGIVNQIDADKQELERMEPRIRQVKKIIKMKQRRLEDLIETANKIARSVARINSGNLKTDVNRFKRRFGKYRNTGNNNNYE